jgi:tetratricopeptide (TPR) repeat protein
VEPAAWSSLAKPDAPVDGHSRVLTTASSWWKALTPARKAASVMLGLLGSAMLLLSVRDRFWPAQGEVAPMTGDVNVAVAEFGSLGADGRVSVTQESSALASSVFEVLDRELDALETAPGTDEPTDFEVRAPEDTGAVDGDKNEDRAAQAAKLAEDIGADIVVYAILNESNSVASATPEFFLTGHHLVVNAPELIGQYQLGTPVEQAGRFSADINARRAVRSVLLHRADGLVHLILGLSYYGARDYGTSISIFNEIETLRLIGVDDGAEILHLFIGNAAGRAGDLDLAESAYRRALEVDPEYARAQVGLAETVFQRSHNDCVPGNADANGVRRSLDMYLGALDADHQPVRSHVEEKVALGAGRAYLCLSMAGIDDHWASAREQLSQVVDAFEAGDDISELAAEAWSSLGLLEIMTSGDAPEALNRATRNLMTAIELGSEPGADPGRLAGWYGMLGYAYCKLGRGSDAVGAYDQALAAYDRANTPFTSESVERQSYADGRARATEGNPENC